MKKLAGFLFALILSSILYAQSASTPRFALVIGNQSYKESPLKNPASDARLMREALLKCGFDVTLAIDLSQKELLDVVGDYAEKVNKAGKDSISFVYYSGHGVQIDGKNYLVPVDNKGIVSETKAKMSCYRLDDFFEYIPSSTQVIVLDACRNNPFSSTKVKFQKGLTRIANPKGVSNFMAFFSTSDGATASDGSGKNSLFTEKLAFHVENDFNASVSNVFNKVAEEVKQASKGQQTPLVTGTGVNFQLMNAEIAAARIKMLQNKVKQEEKSSSSEKTYNTDKKLIQAELAMLEERKKEAEKDAKLKAEEAKKIQAQQKKNQEEQKRLQKEALNFERDYQKNKASQKHCLDFVGEIEDNKEKIQKIRQICADKIYAADVATQKKTDAKIDAVNNAPLKAADKDANGNPNSVILKQRKADIKVLNEENAVQKQKNFDIYYEQIVEEETDRLAALKADEATLNSALYTADSIRKEVLFECTDYDGQSNQWVINLRSNILGRNDFFNTQIPVTYEQLCKNVLGTKYIDPRKMSTPEYETYGDLIEEYNGMFMGKAKPLIVEVDYKFVPAGNGSLYKFVTKSVRVIYIANGEQKVLNEISYSNSTKLAWPKKQTEVKTVEKILKDYFKRDEKVRKEQEKAQKSGIR